MRASCMNFYPEEPLVIYGTVLLRRANSAKKLLVSRVFSLNSPVIAPVNSQPRVVFVHDSEIYSTVPWYYVNFLTLLSQHVLGIPTVQYCSHVHVLRASWSVQLYYSCRSS